MILFRQVPFVILLSLIILSLIIPTLSFGQSSGAGKSDFYQVQIGNFTVNYVQRRGGVDNHPTTVDMTITTGRYALLSSNGDEGDTDTSITDNPVNPVLATEAQIRQRWEHGFSENDMEHLVRVVFPAIRCGDAVTAKQGMKDLFADVPVDKRDPRYVCDNDILKVDEESKGE